MPVPGVKEMVQIVDVPVHVASLDAPMLKALTNLADDRLMLHEEGAVITVGEQELTGLHTPGHTPGQLVVLGGGHAITGDVLFVGHGGVGTLLLCALLGVPISRAYDQGPGGGGNVFAFRWQPRQALSRWQPMETLAAPSAASQEAPA